MNTSINKKLKDLKINDYIIGILIVIVLIGIFNNKKKTNNLLLITLTIGVIIYIYYLETKIKDNNREENKFLSHLDILVTIIFIIGGLIFLYNEIKGDKKSC